MLPPTVAVLRRLGVATEYAASASAGHLLRTTLLDAISARVAIAPRCRPSASSVIILRPGISFRLTTVLGYSGSSFSLSTPVRSVPPALRTAPPLRRSSEACATLCADS